MKFELEPDNRNCPDSLLLEDLVAVARTLNKSTITKEDYDKHGRFCSATIRKRFGSWNKALAKSGLAVAKRINIPIEELKADLLSVSKKLNLKHVSVSQYDANGRFTSVTIERAYGTWNKALEALGLEPHIGNKRKSEEELFDNMATVWETLGRQPKRDELQPPLSRFSAYSYIRRYGSWRNALIAFVENVNKSEDKKAAKTMDALPVMEKTVLSQSRRNHKTSRNVSWRLRFLIMKRDNFACCLCGASPAKDSRTVLHVDHVLAWSNGGETVFENLQTLCETCNIGKSDLVFEKIN